MIGSRVRRRSLLAGAITAAFVALTAAAPAAASAPADGQWYFDVLNVQDAHDAGITGDGVTVAVIDTAVNLEVPTVSGIDVDLHVSPICLDESGAALSAQSTDLARATHGTNVLSYLAGSGEGYSGQTGVRGVAPDVSVDYYLGFPGVYDGGGDVSEPGCAYDDGAPLRTAGEALRAAVEDGVDIISISGSESTSADMDYGVALAISRGIPVVAGLENVKGGPLDPREPGWGNGVVAVEAVDATAAVRQEDGAARVNPRTAVAAPGVGVTLQGDQSGSWQDQILGQGTSYATPIVAGFLALAKQKYPDATGNQLIQALIHSTGGTVHDPEYQNDGLGYGIVSATGILSVDPTTYPDENPLIDPDGTLPSLEEIANPELVLEEYMVPLPSETATPEPSDTVSSAGPGALTIGLIVVAVLVVAAIVAVVIVVAVRRSTKPPVPPAAQ